MNLVRKITQMMDISLNYNFINATNLTHFPFLTKKHVQPKGCYLIHLDSKGKK